MHDPRCDLRLLLGAWGHPQLGELHHLGDARQHLVRRHVPDHHHLLLLQVHIKRRHACTHVIFFLYQKSCCGAIQSGNAILATRPAVSREDLQKERKKKDEQAERQAFENSKYSRLS
jgi:hypothetical protein